MMIGLLLALVACGGGQDAMGTGATTVAQTPLATEGPGGESGGQTGEATAAGDAGQQTAPTEATEVATEAATEAATEEATATGEGGEQATGTPMATATP